MNDNNQPDQTISSGSIVSPNMVPPLIIPPQTIVPKLPLVARKKNILPVISVLLAIALVCGTGITAYLISNKLAITSGVALNAPASIPLAKGPGLKNSNSNTAINVNTGNSCPGGTNKDGGCMNPGGDSVPETGCTPGPWVPDVSSYDPGQYCTTQCIVQSNGCNERSSCGTKACPPVCTDTVWLPDYSNLNPADYCTTECLEQTLCGKTRKTCGTKNCPTPCRDNGVWLPDLSTYKAEDYCADKCVVQTNVCLGEKTVCGTKKCYTPGACVELKTYAMNGDGTFDMTTPLSSVQFSTLKVGDTVMLTTKTNVALLKARFRITIDGITDIPEWQDSTGYTDPTNTVAKLDYRIAKVGKYKIESQVSSKP